MTASVQGHPRRMITSEQQLTRPELARLVLLPGFSTREQVSEISGRGVGMDVVASRMASIKGTVGAEFRTRAWQRDSVAIPGIAGVAAHPAGGGGGATLRNTDPLHQGGVPGGLGQIYRAKSADERNRARMTGGCSPCAMKAAR